MNIEKTDVEWLITLIVTTWVALRKEKKPTKRKQPGKRKR